MSRFSLDGVRDAVLADVTAGLDALQEACQTLWNTLPAEHWEWHPAQVPAHFQRAGEACHKIHGTTGLVGLTPLYESACLLEELNGLGRDRAARAAEDLRLARELSRFCLDRVPRLRRMLELELAGQQEESRKIQNELRADAEHWLGAERESQRRERQAEREERGTNREGPAAFRFDDLAASSEAPAENAAERPQPPGPPEGFAFEEPRLPSPSDEVGRAPGELLQAFSEEVRGLCSELQAFLHRLSIDGCDFAALKGLERIYHTLKGSAAIVGLHRLGARAKQLQDELDRRCAQVAPVSREELLRLLERTNELLETTGLTIVLPPLEEAAPVPEPVDPTPAEDLPDRPVAETVGESVEVAQPWQVPKELWETSQLEAAEILDRLDRLVLSLEGSDRPREVLAALFREYHTLKGVVNTVGLNAIGQGVHRFESLLDDLRRATRLPPMRPLISLMVRVQSRLRSGLNRSEQSWIAEWAELEPQLSRLQLLAVTADAGDPATPAGRDEAHETAERDRSATSDTTEKFFVRVPTRRLDNLMNSVGELVIVRGRQGRRLMGMRGVFRELDSCRQRFLEAVERFRSKHEFPGVAAHAAASSAGGIGSPKVDGAFASRFSELELDRYDDVHILARVLTEVGDDLSEVQGQVKGVLDAFVEDSDQFNALAGELRDEVTRSRMVPLETVFRRLQVPVRELAEREGKEVRFLVSGGRVELDKTILDELHAPLLHLVRNAVAHGLERPDKREGQGKPRAGLLRIDARQDAAQLILEIEDDGQGLDLPRLLQIGRQRGLLPPETTPNDPRVRELIFLPGVSTRTEADAVAGRGVGCDAVRVAIERLNGQVEVDTTPGAGTRFRFTLPLTLAISQALVVRQDRQLYAIPMQFAVRIVDLEYAPPLQATAQAQIEVDGQYLALHTLHAAFRANGGAGAVPRKAVLLKAGDRLLPLAVEHIEGQEEIVVKRLGRVLAGHPLFSGVTFNAEGRLVLILDVHGLLASAGQRPAETHGPTQASGVPKAPVAAKSPALSRRLRVLYVDALLSKTCPE